MLLLIILYLNAQYQNFGEFQGFDMRRNNSIAWDVVGKYATDVFTDEAVRLIEEQPINRPLFMYLAHVAVHTGNRGKYLEAPQSEINKFNHILDPNRRTYAGTSIFGIYEKQINSFVKYSIRLYRRYI